MRAFVVLGLVFRYQAKRLAWGTSLKWPILCWVGRKTLTRTRTIYFLLSSLESKMEKNVQIIIKNVTLPKCLCTWDWRDGNYAILPLYYRTWTHI